MKKVIYLTVISCLIHVCSSAQVLKNYLNKDFYGYENVGSSLFIPNSYKDYWSVSTEQAAPGGTKSLKYTSDANLTERIRVNMGSGDAGIVLDAGTYEMKMKVWLKADADISGITFTIKNPIWKNIGWSFNNIAREEWVELSQEVVITEDILGSTCLFTVNTNHIGKGVMYLDDLQILGEDNTPIILPYISSIESKDNGNISLPNGVYEMKMNVWIDENTSISKFSTYIKEPFVSLTWDISELDRGQWVELSQELVLDKDALNSPFVIQVGNNPEYGGGEGAFYLDDILFEMNSLNVSEEESNSTIILYPNPAGDYLKIKNEVEFTYKIYSITGKLVKFSNEKRKYFDVLMDDLKPGVYLVQIVSGTESEVKKIIVK